MDKSSSAALLIEYDNEKLISGTKVEISERREDRTGLKVVLVVVLALSLLLSCLELAYVCKILTSRKQNNEPNSWKDSFPNSTRDRTRTSNTDSLTLLVSLMANEHFCRQHANKRTQVTPTIQRYLSGHYKRDPRHSSALIANDNSKDVTYGNFRVNPEFITIPKKGFYEVTTTYQQLDGSDACALPTVWGCTGTHDAEDDFSTSGRHGFSAKRVERVFFLRNGRQIKFVCIKHVWSLRKDNPNICTIHREEMIEALLNFAQGKNTYFVYNSGVG